MDDQRNGHPLSFEAGGGLVDCPVALLKVRSEVAAGRGRAGVGDEFARHVVERSQRRHLLCLSWRRHAQIRTGLRPYSGKIRMRQRLAVVAVKQNDVAGFGLVLARVQAQANAFDLADDLASQYAGLRRKPAVAWPEAKLQFMILLATESPDHRFEACCSIQLSYERRTIERDRSEKRAASVRTSAAEWAERIA